MINNNSIKKIKKVILSCETNEQLDVAIKYSILMKNKLIKNSGLTLKKNKKIYGELIDLWIKIFLDQTQIKKEN